MARKSNHVSDTNVYETLRGIAVQLQYYEDNRDVLGMNMARRKADTEFINIEGMIQRLYQKAHGLNKEVVQGVHYRDHTYSDD